MIPAPDWRKACVQAAIEGRNPTVLADAVEAVCRRLDPAWRRVDVEILGNSDAFLHCHI